MHPELFTIGGITVYTYGIFVAAGFLAAMQYVVKYSGSTGFSKNSLYDFFFYIILAGIAGARLLFVLTDLKYFLHYPLEIFKLWNGGLVYYGGFISALAFAFGYLKFKKISAAKTADVFAPAVALGHFFGRIGCFFSGCCYGKECDLFFAAGGKYPTQLTEAFCNLMIFFILHSLNKKQHKPGFVFVMYLIMYPAVRFIIEFFRGDDRGAFILGLSIAQFISLIIIVVSVLIIKIKYYGYEKK